MLLIFGLGLCGSGIAEENDCAPEPPATFRTFSFYFENDAFFKTDSQYTNGLRLSYTTRPFDSFSRAPLPEWIRKIGARLPLMNQPGDSHHATFTIGQSMYTPEDTDSTDLIEDDRPYAGILFLAAGFDAFDMHRQDTIDFILGMAGPASFAECNQANMHRLMGYDKPKGWDNQIGNEPVGNIYVSRKWKERLNGPGPGFDGDMIATAAFGLGNLATVAGGGLEFRIGWNLPNDFGNHGIWQGGDPNAAVSVCDPRYYPNGKRVGIYGFSGINLGYTAYRMDLDGNFFGGSHRVTRIPVVGEVMLGWGIIFKRLKLTFIHIIQTRQFEEQSSETHEFGSITLSYSF